MCQHGFSVFCALLARELNIASVKEEQTQQWRPCGLWSYSFSKVARIGFDFVDDKIDTPNLCYHILILP